MTLTTSNVMSKFLTNMHSTTLPFLNNNFYVLSTQRRFMSKFLSKSATKRLPLTSKRARKGYYKGTGARKEGKITSLGRFIVDPTKRMNLIVPENLETFKLKPYIARTVPKWAPEDRR
mmetsp:Transcript_26361/g.38203  ORF Transcript_26361/g.38203 Transcript_26361/m.38203 type:complete len:118 (+) Transcript_26361:257-610(+)